MPKRPKVPLKKYQEIVEDIMRLRRQQWPLGKIREYIREVHGVDYSKEGLMYIIAREEGREWKHFQRGRIKRSIRRKKDIEWVLVFSDLHLIHRDYTDLKGFYYLLEKVRKGGYRVDAIVGLGDIIDGVKKYWKQLFLSPTTRNIENVQRMVLERVVKDLRSFFPNAEIFFLRGNHEDEYTNDLLVEFCKFYNIHYSKRLKIGRVLFTHTIDKRLSGSYALGPTIQMLVESFLGLPRILNIDFDMIVQGHIHKTYVKLHLGGKGLICLPSFLIDEDREGRSGLYDNTIILLNVKSMQTIEFKEKKNPIDEIRFFNVKFLKGILEDLYIPEIISL